MAAALGALGVAASATQLAAYALSIVAFIADARERMRNAPEQYREYEAQLKILINIASSVENVPALQTPEVKFHLETTATEVRTLQALICCRAPSPNTSFILRCSSWEAVQGSQQRRVSDHLERLHKKNTALLFYIVTINTVQLSTIMANTAPELEQEGYEIGENKEIEAAMPPGCELLDLDPDLAALVRKLDGRDRKTLAIVFQGLSNTGRQSPSPRRNRPSGIKKSTVNPGYSPGQQYRPYSETTSFAASITLAC